MKKRLAALWVAWLLAQSPNTNAQIDSTKIDAQKDLASVMSEKWTNTEDSTKTISFEDARKQHELLKNVLKNKKIQELVDEYWQEKVEEMINEIITNDDTGKIMEQALKDAKVQKALEEWNEEDFSKLIEEIIKDFYKDSLWWKVVDKVFFWVMTILLWEWLKRKFDY